MAERIQRQLKRCGAKVVATATFPTPGGCGGALLPPALGLGDPTRDSLTARISDLQRFRDAGVTTVLWLGCHSPYYGPAAAALRYLPEWIVLGDYLLDGTYPYVSSDNLNSVFDRHAIAVTPRTFAPKLDASYCYRALREVDPTLPASYPDSPAPQLEDRSPEPLPTREQANQSFTGCSIYPIMLQLFSALQLAGPRLTPTSLERGLRELPYLSSPDPQTPSCYYGSAFNCIQDAIAEYYDNNKDCWRAIDGGRRFLTDRWPSGNIDAQIRGTEPCNFSAV
jgi:hypothetical protein